jgi:hypothetical protein
MNVKHLLIFFFMIYLLCYTLNKNKERFVTLTDPNDIKLYNHLHSTRYYTDFPNKNHNKEKLGAPGEDKKAGTNYMTKHYGRLPLEQCKQKCNEDPHCRIFVRYPDDYMNDHKGRCYRNDSTRNMNIHNITMDKLFNGTLHKEPGVNTYIASSKKYFKFKGKSSYAKGEFKNQTLKQCLDIAAVPSNILVNGVVHDSSINSCYMINDAATNQKPVTTYNDLNIKPNNNCTTHIKGNLITTDFIKNFKDKILNKDEIMSTPISGTAAEFETKFMEARIPINNQIKSGDKVKLKTPNGKYLYTAMPSESIITRQREMPKLNDPESVQYKAATYVTNSDAATVYEVVSHRGSGFGLKDNDNVEFRVDLPTNPNMSFRNVKGPLMAWLESSKDIKTNIMYYAPTREKAGFFLYTGDTAKKAMYNENIFITPSGHTRYNNEKPQLDNTVKNATGGQLPNHSHYGFNFTFEKVRDWYQSPAKLSTDADNICPFRWEQTPDTNKCMANSFIYKGPCAIVTPPDSIDFSNYTKQQKLDWSTKCLAPWKNPNDSLDYKTIQNNKDSKEYKLTFMKDKNAVGSGAGRVDMGSNKSYIDCAKDCDRRGDTCKGFTRFKDKRCIMLQENQPLDTQLDNSTDADGYSTSYKNKIIETDLLHKYDRIIGKSSIIG